MPEEAIGQRLAEGVRLARGGLLVKALQQLDLAAASPEPAIAAEALRHLSDIHRSRCDWAAALKCAQRSGRLAESAALPELLADALKCYRRGLDLAVGLGAQVELDRLRGKLERHTLKIGSGEEECAGAARESF